MLISIFYNIIFNITKITILSFLLISKYTLNSIIFVLLYDDLSSPTLILIENFVESNNNSAMCSLALFIIYYLILLKF